MAQPTNIKVVIENFCQILHRQGFSKLTAEVFRQAKFDISDATRPLWVLIYETLNFVAHDDAKITPQTDKEIVMFVKTSLYHIGYKNEAFFSLSPLTLEGSRELLLAFGWLLAKYQVMQYFLDHVETPLFDLLVGTNKSEKIIPCAEPIELNDKLDKLLFEYRRNKLEWRNLRQIHNRVANLIVKRELNLEDKSLQSFINEGTILELFASMCSKERHDAVISLLDTEGGLLKCLIKWFEAEDLFWKWLNSVLDEKRKTQLQDAEHGIDTGLKKGKGFIPLDIYNVDRHFQGLDIGGQESTIAAYDIRNSFHGVTTLLEKMSFVQWVPTEKSHSGATHGAKAESITDDSDVRESVEKLETAVLQLKHEHISLKDEMKANLTDIFSEIFTDVVHLPLPKR